MKLKLLLFSLSFFLVSTLLVAQRWNQEVSPTFSARKNPVSFVIGNTAYLGTGFNGSYLNDFESYNSVTKTWSTIAPIPGAGREAAIAFEIGGDGYVGLGWSTSGGSSNSSMYKYNPTLNSWTLVAPYPGSGGRASFCVVHNGEAYIGAGGQGSASLHRDLWKYNPISNTWTSLGNFPFTNRTGGEAFSLGGFLYFGFGHNNSVDYKDIWRYNPNNSTWLQINSFPGVPRLQPISFVINGTAYVGGGHRLSGAVLNDYYEFNPALNTWTTLCNFPGVGRSNATGFVADNQGFVFAGRAGGTNYLKDLWSYFPLTSTYMDTVLCGSQSLFVDKLILGGTYLWKNNSTLATQTITQPGIYWVDVVVNGCTVRDSIEVFYFPTPAINLGNDTSLCIGETLLLDATIAGGSYGWKNNSTLATQTITQAGIYWVDVTVNGCTTRDSITVTYLPNPIVDLGNDTIFCDNSSLFLDATTAGGTYLWQDNSTLSTFTITQTGIYWVDVTVNGCTTRDSISVTYATPPNINLGNDTSIYNNSVLNLDVTTIGGTYLWQDNSTLGTFTVTQAGVYWVDVTLNGCTTRDSIIVNYVPNSNTISGIINEYAKVTQIISSPCSDTLVVSDTTGFSQIDNLLIIQMQGATINSSNTSTYGDIISLNDAGNYEFAKIRSVGSNFIVISGSLTKSYSTASSVQVVTIPTFSKVNVSNRLTAKKWDGNEGGILALDVIDTLILNGNIELESCGFRKGLTYSGAGYSFSSSSCGRTNYFAPLGNFNGGEKGEGITINPIIQNYGRGHVANGGGGGNSHNSGGGGGSNAGFGGKGGNEFSNCPSPAAIGGIGGEILPYTLSSTKVFLGGGGGGGDSNGPNGSDGGAGGGIIFLKSNVVIANNKTISSNGESAGSSGSDGAGGGGAGGAIMLDFSIVQGTLIVSANGGDGGDMTNGGSCVGTGGGGSGGYIKYSNSSILGNTNMSSSGGLGGIATSPLVSCFNTNYGSTSGTNGAIQSNLSTLFTYTSTQPFLVSLGNDTILCNNDPLLFDVTTSGGSYLWQDNSTLGTFTVTQTGTYWVDVTVNGCTIRDSINVKYSIPIVNLGNDTTLCAGETLLLDATTAGGSYGWKNNSTLATQIITQAGIYWVDVTVNGCTTRDSITVTYFPNPIVDLGNDTNFCDNSALLLVATNAGGAYLWQDNSTLGTFTVTQTGIYWVDVTVNGCTTRDSIEVTYFTPPLVNLGNDTALCLGETLLLDATIAGGSYGWKNNSTLATQTITQAGIYWVDVTVNGCTTRDSITVTYLPNPIVDLGNDTLLCKNEVLTLDVTAIGASYLWSNDSVNPIQSFVQSSSIWVDVTANGCTTRDTINLKYIDVPFLNFMDTILCANERLLLDAFNEESVYLWQDGSSDSKYNINKDGIYFVQVSNQCGTISDTAQVQFIECDCFDNVSNVFSPNDDGVNDVFETNIDCPITTFKMNIFNRWGENVYTTENQYIYWDGRIGGYKAPTGTYFYIIEYTNPYSQSRFTYNGTLTLVR